MVSRALSIGCALVLVLVLAACGDQRSSTRGVDPPTLSPVIETVILPQVVPLTPVFGFGCPFVPPFTSAFDIIVRERAGLDVFMDRVSLQFIDGTNLGASPITIPQLEIARRFPSTLIRGFGSRSFRFTPQFGCGIGVPRSLLAELLFLDRFDRRHRSTLRVALR
jgi:hypothetical protein